MPTGSFPGVKSGRGVTLTPHLLLMPRSRKSRAIPLLPLWAVQPVQRLSACTTVYLYLYLYLYSPYGPYGLYRASVPVQRCTFNFTYTSTPPMGRTACTEPQCLYNGAPLTLPISYVHSASYDVIRNTVYVGESLLLLSFPHITLTQTKKAEYAEKQTI